MAMLAFTDEAARRLQAIYRPRTSPHNVARPSICSNCAQQKSIIDVGCGPGFLSEGWPMPSDQRAHVLGIDISEDLLAFAEERK
jgi:arsenite methyltransferase